MSILSETKEGLVPYCKLKKKDYPDYDYFVNSIPFESREKLYTELPSPVVEWSDYYQTIPDVANKIRKDQLYVKKVLGKKEKLRKLREQNGEKQ